MNKLQTTVLLFLFYFIFNARASETNFQIYSQFDLFKSNHAQKTDLSSDWEMRKSQKGQWGKIDAMQPLPLNEQLEFHKIFTLDSNKLGEKYQLEMNGLNGSCAIYLNDKLLGTHQGGTPVFLQIPAGILSFQNPNELFVLTSNTFDYKNSIPLKYRVGGIPLLARPFSPTVILQALPQTFVSTAHLTFADENQHAVLRLDAQISHPPLKIKVPSRWNQRYLRIQILDKEKSVSVWKSEILRPVRTADEETVFQANIPLSRISFWQVEAPHNYELNLSFGSEGQSQKIGAFSFAVRTEPQNPFSSMQGDSAKKMKCIEWIADRKYAFKTHKEKRNQIESDLELIKEIHANSIRIFASAPEPFLLNMCDSLGLGVLVEIPLCDTPPNILEKSNFREKTEKLFKDYIQAFKNHPSVIAWGTGSGYVGSDLRTQEFVGALKRIAAKWDNRPVYASVATTKKIIQSMAVDYQIIETAIDGYGGSRDKFFHYTTSDKNIIRISVPLAPQKENLLPATNEQAVRLQEILSKIMESKTAAGIIVSPLRDWAGETPHLLWGPRRGANIFLAGLLDVNSKTRPALDVVKSNFENKGKADHPLVQQSSETILFELFEFVLLIFFLMFVRSDRVFRNYLRRIFLFPHGFYIDMSENRRVSLFLTSLVGTTCIVTLSLIFASYIYFLRSSSSFDNILTWFFSNPQLKYKVIWLIWHPILLVLFFIIFLYLLILLQSVLFKIVAFFQHRYIKWTQFLTFVLWVPASLLFAAPIAIILYRLLERSTFVLPVSALLLIILLWTILRIFRATKVILQLSNLQTFILYIFVLGLFIAGFGGYLEYHRSLLAYSGYFISLFGF